MSQQPSLQAGRAAARLSKRLEVALAGVEMSLPQFRLLGFLSSRPEAASVLASQMAVSPPTVTNLVDGLVARGFVERMTDPDDRRRVRHDLTPAGRAALAAASATLAERLDTLAAHLSPAQARRAVEGLELWNVALDAEAQAATL